MKHRTIRLATLATLASPGSLACDKTAKVGADTPNSEKASGLVLFVGRVADPTVR